VCCSFLEVNVVAVAGMEAVADEGAGDVGVDDEIGDIVVVVGIVGDS
jgi:hypothetical protein